MNNYLCAFSIANWQAIERNGGIVYHANEFSIYYGSPEKIINGGV